VNDDRRLVHWPAVFIGVCAAVVVVWGIWLGLP